MKALKIITTFSIAAMILIVNSQLLIAEDKKDELETLMEMIDFDPTGIASSIKTSEPYTIDTVTDLVNDLFGDTFKEETDLLWADDNRVSMRSANGKIVYNILSGTFSYHINGWINHAIAQCKKDELNQKTAENIVSELQKQLPDFSSSWIFIKRHEYVADSGTPEGPNNDQKTVLYEYRFSRLIDGYTPSVGPGSEARVYLSPCGELMALKFNWRHVGNTFITRQEDILTNKEVAETILEYKDRHLYNNTGCLTEETIQCGYYEPEEAKAVTELKPVCIYSAKHSRDCSCESDETFPVEFIIPLTNKPE